MCESLNPASLGSVCVIGMQYAGQEMDILFLINRLGNISGHNQGVK